MSLGFKDIGNLTATQANDSVKISDMSGDTGVGPPGLVIMGSAIGLPPSDGGYGYQLFPGGHFVNGTDSFGDIGTSITAFNSGDDINFDIVGGGTLTFTNGFWKSSVRGLLTGLLIDDAICDFEIQFTILNPVLSYDPNIAETPNNIQRSNPTWNGVKGTTTISADFTNSTVVDPTAIAFYRDDLPLASIPWVNGITSYSYDDVVFAPGIYTYYAVVYKYGSPNTVSGPSDSISVEFGHIPTFEIVGEGGFTLGGTALFDFGIDPAGIYKLVLNKTHDTIYLDVNVDGTTKNVKIPDPFIKTYFSGR
jgi:hypothetical protein